MAAAFAPQMAQTPEADLEDWRSLVGGEYYYAVHRENGAWFGLPGLEIAYLPAYYRDLGTPTIFGNTFDRHDGDSEFLVVDVTFFQGQWSFTRAFLSAHCGSDLFGISFIQTAPGCQWYNADNWPTNDGYVGGVLFGAPVVWVAYNKHGMYYSYNSCDSGQFDTDWCTDTPVRARFPVTSGFNIGSSTHHFVDWVGGRRGSPQVQPGATESMWDTDTSRGFRGWQLAPFSGGVTTPYGKILAGFGF
jgi:hypothetical protein